MSRAFDRLNHNLLMIKLMDRKLPSCLVNLLYCWYSKLFSFIKWGNGLSILFHITVGVRQGGTLSPSFFAIFVDSILNKLEKSMLGCHISGICLNSLMYADDLVLLSVSICDLQSLVNMFLHELDTIDMIVNCRKSACLRIGNRHSVHVQNIIIGTDCVPREKEIKYLGIIILSTKKFTINLQKAKQRYFRALNAIFRKVGLNTSPMVLCSLINSFCLPILLYGAEAVLWTNKMLSSIEYTYSQAFMKIFRTFDRKIIEYCQYSIIN